MPETGIRIPVLPAHIPPQADRLHKSNIHKLPRIPTTSLYPMPLQGYHNDHEIPGWHILNLPDSVT